MTVTATLSRGSRSIDLKIIDEGGTPLIAEDIGKPQVGFDPTGGLDPRPQQDVWANLRNYRITTQLIGESAHNKAIRLADMIKSHSQGMDLTLDIPLQEFDSNIKVQPEAESQEALSLTYEPGKKNIVSVDLGLTRIDRVDGTESGNRAETPRSSGDGPLIITDGTNAVRLETDLEITRTVGRPNDDVRGQRISDYPAVTSQRKTAYDAIEIGLHFSNNVITKTTTLIDMFAKRRGRNTLTLKFNGLYGMGSFEVFPRGSQALRHVRQAGRKGDEDQVIPTIDVRVVNVP